MVRTVELEYLNAYRSVEVLVSDIFCSFPPVPTGSFFGNPVPDDFINQKLNLLESIYADEDSGEDIRAVMNGIESVSVQDKQIVIKPRRGGNDEWSEFFYFEEDDVERPVDYEPVPVDYLGETSSEVPFVDMDESEGDDKIDEAEETVDYAEETGVNDEDGDPFFYINQNTAVLEEHDPVPDDLNEKVAKAEDNLDEAENVKDDSSEDAPDYIEAEDNRAAPVDMVVLEANKVEPARPQQAVVTTHLRAAPSNP